MALKKTDKSSDSRIAEINAEISKLHQRIQADIETVSSLQSDKLSLEIAPFKVGDYALVEIATGRTRKQQKCLLECVDGILYARPVKNDGKLSGRHFSVIPFGKKYSDVLKPVEG